MKMESVRYGKTCVNDPADSGVYDFPPPYFFDFDKMRCEECFAVGQIWALYDAPDTMPRFYAQIRKVFPSSLEFLVTCIEADPDGENNSCLPISCGKFKSGNRETVFKLTCFSHQVYPVEISGRGVFRIFPRKGSTWALFKNWDIEWESKQVPERRYEYEFVEVLTDYDERFGVCVAFLDKVKDFESVFCKINREGRKMLQVPPGEMSRFSHMIPSFQLTGEEEEGVPMDSFELDPLSLPKDTEEMAVEGFGLDVGKTHSSGQCSSPSPEVDDDDDDYPEPDFNDFGKLKKIECFSVGQTWAMYDDLEGMPRSYAQIGKVWCRSKLRVTWLKHDPYGMNGIVRVEPNLPASCGKFRCGVGEAFSVLNCFSHRIYPVESSQGDSIKILPRKGSTWALFKNWDIMCKSHQVSGRKRKSHQVPEQKHEYQYEFVEVLDDYDEDVGLRVAFLGKVKGFVSVFSRINREGKNTHQIPPGELLRFSHMVPSFKLTGEEGEGVPKDSFELDPLSLPKNIEETTEWFRLYVSKAHSVGPCLSSDGNINVSEDDSAPSPSLNLEAVKIPVSEFFDFHAAKSPKNVWVGQVWAFYCNKDGLPKYYALIEFIDRSKFKVQIRWLYALRPSRDIVLWSDIAMPVSCGTFKVERKSISYTDTDAFSHRVTVKKITGHYVISPKKGEVWALYRNWSTELKVSDLKNCQYDIAEVLEECDLHIRVQLFEKVTGFHSVFKPLMNGETALTMNVIRPELARFSHQMPAFRLTDQRDGALRGFWEVDPAAVPIHYFSLNV